MSAKGVVFEQYTHRNDGLLSCFVKHGSKRVPVLASKMNAILLTEWKWFLTLSAWDTSSTEHTVEIRVTTPITLKELESVMREKESELFEMCKNPQRTGWSAIVI